ncbi:MAG TPA: glycosyltransferase family 39 protein, partial [Anaerolineae bacterium]
MRETRWVWLLAILLLAAGLRFYHVSGMSLRADEATNLFTAVQEPAAMIQPFITSDPHPPLYFLILHYWMLVGGRSELALRFPTAFMGVMVVALVFALGKLLFPRRADIAVLGALLAAINPYLIWDAQDAYMYTFLTAIAVCSFIAFEHALRPAATRKDWGGYVIVNALGLLLHYLFGLALLAQGLLWLAWAARGQISRRTAVVWVVAQGVTATLVLPWLVASLPMLSNFKTEFFPPAGLLEIAQRSLLAFSIGRVDSQLMPAMVEPVIGSVLGLGFLVIFLLGLFLPTTVSGNADDTRGRILLATFLFAPLLGLALFSLLRFPIYDERYTLFLIPAFLLILARGFAEMGKRTTRRWVPWAALAFVVVASAYSLNNYFNVPQYAKSPDWRGAVQYITSQSRPGDVVIQNYPDPALPYYLQDRLPRALLPHSSFDPAATVSADLDRVTGNSERVWFQPVPFATWDTNGLVATWLDRHALELDVHEFHGVRLELYQPAAAALRQSVPVGATFADRIQLIAFRLNALDNLGRSNTTVHLTLFWKVLNPIDRNATVFIHLSGPDGQLVAQQDNQPVRGTYPTDTWQMGEIVIDAYELLIPTSLPAGSFTLAVGMYDSQTQE